MRIAATLLRFMLLVVRPSSMPLTWAEAWRIAGDRGISIKL